MADQGNAPLMLSIEANLTKLNKQLAQAAQQGATAAKQIDTAFTTANDNVAKSFAKTSQVVTTSIGAQRNAVQNLSYQLNDIATGLASGTSPFTLMAQQGSQVVQALEEAGGTAQSAFTTIAGAVGQVINPLSLATFAVIGLGAAAFEYLATWRQAGELTGDALTKQIDAAAKLGEQLKSIYPDYAALTAKLKENNDHQTSINTATEDYNQKLAQSRTAMTAVVVGAAEAQTKIMAAFGPETASAFDRVYQSTLDIAKQFQAGTATADQMRDALTALINELGQFDIPTLQPFVDQLKTGLQTMPQLAQAAQTTKNSLDGLTAGVDASKVEAFQKAMDKLGKDGVDSTDKAKQAMLDYADAIAKATNAWDALNAETAKNQAIGNIASTALTQAESSSQDDYFRIVRQYESHGSQYAHSPLSTASGQYQMLDSTFLEFAKAVPEFANASKEQLLAQKNDPGVQQKVIEAYTNASRQMLNSINQPANNTNLYLAHLLGQQGARSVLTAPRDAPIEPIVGAKVVANNPQLLGNGRTVQQSLDAITTALHGADLASSDAMKSFEDTIQSMKDSTDAINAEAKASGNLGQLIDQTTLEREKAKDVMTLEQAARKQGLTIGAAEKKQIEDVATAHATAEASVKGYSQEQHDAKVQTDAHVEAQKKLAQQLAQTRDQFAGMATSFVSGFISDLKSGTSASDALRNALSKLADQLLDMTLNEGFKMLFQGLFPGATTISPASGSSGFLGALAGLIPSAHTGGVVGIGGVQRSVSPMAFIGAPRMHNGGLAGDEVAAILQRGETVIPRGTIGAGGGQVSNSIGSINIDMSGSGVVAADSQKGRQFGNLVQTLIQREMVRQSKPGGLLRSSGSGGRVGT